MAVPVIMPKLEMSQESATLIEWLAQEGDRVEKGAPLFEIETDKVTVQVEAPASGVLAGILVQPGATVPVASVIAHLLQPGEDAIVAAGLTGPEPQATPIAQRLAAELGLDLAGIGGSGPGGRITRADVEAVAPTRPRVSEGADPAVGSSEGSPGKLRATPAARQLARESGVDLATVVGSGPRGRIQRDDVGEAAADLQHAHRHVVVEAPATVEGAGAPVESQEAEPTSTLIQFSGMRATIARRMSESYRTAPHIHLTLSVDVDAAEEARSRWAEIDGQRITFTAVLVKACAWALRRHPAVNATVEEKGVRQWRHINVGVAVALSDVLIVPVIRHADRLSTGELAVVLQDLSERAQAGTLMPEEVTGGTFTLTNLGMFGIESFDPILNPPQVAILGAGAVVPTVVPSVDSGERPPPRMGRDLIVRLRMQLTLAADHRALDGAMAARFLQDLRLALEDPTLMLL